MLTGHFNRWGKNLEDNPERAPIPEILDIEVSTICNGIPNRSEKISPCEHCYKSNTKAGKNMSFDTFRSIIDKWSIPPLQIAFGIGDINANEDFWEMITWSRTEKNIIPNYTTNGYGATEENVRNTQKFCGAVAVSVYERNKDICYDAIKEFTEDKHNKIDFQREKLQVNIHCLLSKETLDFCYEVCEDIKSDKRLEKLNSIVFLLLKPKGRGKAYNKISLDEYKKFISYLFDNDISFGHDSCCSGNLLSVAPKDHIEHMRLVCEPCESSLFSSYISVDGIYYPCSFAEGQFEGIDTISASSFVKDVWKNERTEKFREILLKSTENCLCVEKKYGCRACPIFDITICESYRKRGRKYVCRYQRTLSRSFSY